MLKRILAYFYYLIQKYILKNEYKATMGRWFYENGDEKYLLNHPLKENSIVFDVGGYTGVFTQKLIAKHDPYLYIFEPVKEYYIELLNKFGDNEKLKIFQFGLADKTGETEIKIEGDKSSLFIDSGDKEKIKLVDIAEFMNEHKIDKVDLLNINIEGGEYPLLKRLLEKDLIKKYQFIQVQFHNFIKNSNEKREKIVNDLQKTHRPTFSFPFVWEGFERK